jgi:predicted nucleic acid-binding protein
MAIILDTSVSLAWLMPGSTVAQEAIADRVLAYLETDPLGVAVVPSLWWLEWTNAISRAQRGSLINPQQIADYTELIAALALDTKIIGADEVLTRVLPLAISAGLTTYDATYLALAIQLKTPIATADAALREAAIKNDVTLF